jgi:hypothetical protein
MCFGIFARCVGIAFCKRNAKIAFCLAFPLEHEKQAKKSKNIAFLFLAIYLAPGLELL